MIVDGQKQTFADETSYLVPLSHYDSQHLSSSYELRRHKFESESNAGCQEARLDWIKYIGPIEQFGGCNPINGNFAAVSFPLAKPERLRLIAYVFEYAFLYDDIIEVEKSVTLKFNDQKKHEWKNTNPALGKTQIQAKMMTQLASIDKACTERIKHTWKEMINATLRDKDKRFSNLEEYVEFRMTDSGTRWVESVLLFSMGITLTEEEDLRLEKIRRPSFIALGLANDFFSFDREYAEYLESEKLQPITNSVWLHMQWYNVDVDNAKRITLEAIRSYEEQFLKNSAEFRQINAPIPEKLRRYLDALAYLVSGNFVWSMNCPRYHPAYRYDPNAGIEDEITAESLPKTLGLEYDASPTLLGGEKQGGSSRCSSTDTSLQASEDDKSTRRDDVSISSCMSMSLSDSETKQKTGDKLLNLEHVKAPFNYIASLPSKGVRDTFIDALNIWFDIPEPITSRIKSLGNRLHAASLMLDDVEDRSNLRRGQPATHTVFGTAQTINSGCYEILQAIDEAHQLGVARLKIVLDELAELHIGQSYDLFWTRHSYCPSEDEYLEMAKKKTGGLFRLLARLLLASASNKPPNVAVDADIQALGSLIGMQYQIRDDYQNLWSSEYSFRKGFCEDLDEGKISFPLVHALSSYKDSALLRELLQQRRDARRLSDEQKRLVLDQLDRAGSMMYTRETLMRLQRQIDAGVKRIEDATRTENWVLRALLQGLEVCNEM